MGIWSGLTFIIFNAVAVLHIALRKHYVEVKRSEDCVFIDFLPPCIISVGVACVGCIFTVHVSFYVLYLQKHCLEGEARRVVSSRIFPRCKYERPCATFSLTIIVVSACMSIF